jgi:hypothetical protein
MCTPCGGRGWQRQLAVGQDHALVRRDQVDAIGLDGHALSGLDDRHRRFAAQDLRHLALGVRLQVHDEQQGHLRVGREMPQELGERLQAARRGADADDGERQRALLLGRRRSIIDIIGIMRIGGVHGGSSPGGGPQQSCVRTALFYPAARWRDTKCSQDGTSPPRACLWGLPSPCLAAHRN